MKRVREHIFHPSAILPAPAVLSSTRFSARLKRVGNTVHAGMSVEQMHGELLRGKALEVRVGPQA